MPLNPRSGRPRQRAVNAFHAQCRNVDAACWLCGNPIDYRLERHRHPLRFSVDELVPISHDPASALDLSLFRPAHACCNSSRGNRPVTPAVRRACATVYRKHAERSRRTLSAAW